MPARQPADPGALSERIRIGIDVVAVERVRRLLHEHPDFTSRVFTADEVGVVKGRRRAERLAGRFAAKEAVLKALGTGLGPRMRWTDVEITNAPGGRPRVRLDGAVAAWASAHRVEAVEVSLSHSAGLAVAQSLVLSAAPSR